MKEADKAFIQGYHAQAAVDAQAQVIVACTVTNQAADAPHAVPMVEQIVQTLGSEPLIATRQQRHGNRVPDAPRGRPPASLTIRERMHRRLRTHRGRRLYARRKAIVAPVFGLIKRARGFRQFLLRGLTKVHAEWTLICLTHNLLTGIPSHLFYPKLCIIDDEDLDAALELLGPLHEKGNPQVASAGPDWTCPQCGESVPAGFDQCWKCDAVRHQPA